MLRDQFSHQDGIGIDPWLNAVTTMIPAALHSYPLKYLTQEKWIPNFWSPILNIFDVQQPGMIKIIRTVQAIFQISVASLVVVPVVPRNHSIFQRA